METAYVDVKKKIKKIIIIIITEEPLRSEVAILSVCERTKSLHKNR